MRNTLKIVSVSQPSWPAVLLVAQGLSPELGAAYPGAQGDVWDAQNDMAAALGGSLLGVLLIRTLRGRVGASPLSTEQQAAGL